ncbi:MAG: acyl-CoA/acyl-ACP dehydrogenase [Actinomycetota bacterium]|nr:acyl-CoA/acyl-ACP dehydrogenase [Actinomycetota bacterium]MDD5665852.1 acyl-CoA/acyl-ACP dehydrogenase [Actinomycetota bacterium]
MSEHEIFPCMYEWLTDMDVSLAGNLRRWADNEVMARRLELKESYEQLLEPAMRQLFLEIGLQRLLWPEKYGGDGHNSPKAAVTMVAALEQVSRGDTSIALLLSSMWALQSCMAMEGKENHEACEAFAELFGSQDTLAITSLVLPLFRDEPQARAKLAKGAWSVEAKSARPLASGADAAVFGVLCSGAGSDIPGDEVCVIALPAAAKGIKRGKPFLKTGMAADRNAPVSFDKAKAPEGLCVARGLEACRGMLSWLYLGVAASTVGALFAAYEILKEWGDNRVIKGKGQTFKNNPLTSSVMAEVAREISVSRMLTCDLGRVLSEPGIYGPAGEEGNFVLAEMVANTVTLSAEKAIGGAMEMMASAGYATEWNLERYWRDTKTLQVCLGPYELAKMDYARYFYQSEAR